MFDDLTPDTPKWIAFCKQLPPMRRLALTSENRWSERMEMLVDRAVARLMRTVPPTVKPARPHAGRRRAAPTQGETALRAVASSSG
ncbi:MAG: hypothetical protein H6639_13495 [Caldilineaceae bacterium]|nr:hypothetical protein [Caldilineaceae bacterium]